jgi:hypothetical protein
MRNRHLPRLCRSCAGPMARQEDTCWRCGARCADEPQPAAKLRVVLPMVLTIPQVRTADAVGAANVGADRCANERGAFAAPDRAADVAGSGGRR